MKRIQVVCGIIEKDGRVFAVRRGETKYEYTSHKWEFPGGKIEPGETASEALKRELQEELDIEVRVGDKVAIVEHQYPDFVIRMDAFRCTLVGTQPVLKEHVEMKWCTLEDLRELDWAPADIPIMKTYVGLSLN